MIDWSDISYLKDGTQRQRQAYGCLVSLAILPALQEYSPILVSTVCNDIDIEGSDLDIICEVHDHGRFTEVLTTLYGAREGFALASVPTASLPATVCQFRTPLFEIEVFGQALPVRQQNGYRHMAQTHRVIALGGEGVRRAIRDAKKAGMKTEPAVAALLGLDGDPYQAVLALEAESDDSLRRMLEKS